MPIRPDHFFEPVHGRIFERILQLLDRKAVVTPVTLKPYFEADEALKELGGAAYLARLTADGQGLLAPRELAEQIYDLALLRELAGVGRVLVENALDTSERVDPQAQIRFRKDGGRWIADAPLGEFVKKPVKCLDLVLQGGGLERPLHLAWTAP